MKLHKEEFQNKRNDFSRNPKSLGNTTSTFVDNRPEAVAQMKLQQDINNSPVVQQLKSFQEMADNSPQVAQLQSIQRMANQHVVQKAGKNKTGLPDNLKSGIESMSGMSMDDVKVHYNSDKPSQLNAHAYAQGTDIHVGPGQGQHLAHEAWHVVQQKQGRVKATTTVNGKGVNDNKGLEKEADVMGAKASSVGANLQMKKQEGLSSSSPAQLAEVKKKKPAQMKAIQRAEVKKKKPPKM